MMRARTWYLVCIFIILLIYSNSFYNEFVWDDHFLIEKNPSIMSWRHAWIHFALDLYHSYSNYYRPLQALSYTLDYSLWKLNPWGYHLTNTVLHIAVVLLVARFVRVLTGDFFLSCAASIFFAVHPAHTAAVAYISGRADLLVSVFTLCSLIACVYYVRNGETGKKTAWFYASLISFICALLSRENAIVLPFLILLTAWIVRPDSHSSRRVGRMHYYSWYFITAGVYGALRLNALNFQEGIFSAHRYTLWERALTAVKAFSHYSAQAVFPLGLRMEHTISYVTSLSDRGVLTGFSLLACISALMYMRTKRTPYTAYGILFFVISLLPMLNLYPLSINFADHWIYFPLIGAALTGADLMRDFLKRFYRLRHILYGVMALYLTCLGVYTFQRNYDWKNRETIYMHTLLHNPRSVKIVNNLGNLYRSRGDIDRALYFHNRAVAESPRDYRSHLNLGYDYYVSGRYKEALESYRLALIIKPDYVKAYLNRAAVFTAQGRNRMAADAYRNALRYDKNNMIALTNLGNIYYTAAEYDKAIEYYKRAARIFPDVPEIHNNSAQAYEKREDYRQALRHWRVAVELRPDNASYRMGLGVCYARLGQYDEALIHLRAAHAIAPRTAAILINTGLVHLKEGNKNKAGEMFKKALYLEPENRLARTYLSSLR